MHSSGDAAESIVRMSLQGLEVAAKKYQVLVQKILQFYYIQ